MKTIRAALAAVALAAAAAAVGCSGEHDMPTARTFPVKGKVVNGSTPLSGGRLTLFIMDTSKYGPAEATADIKPDGTFEPVAIGGSPGLMPGRWKVVVSPTGYRDGKAYRIRESIPAKYTKEDSTDLVIDVVEGDNAPVINLR